MEIARIRFGLIAPMVQGTFPDESMSAYCRRAAAFPVKLPDGRQVQYKAKTLTKWLSLYNRGGMDALVPKTRCDKGGTRVITEEAETEIRRHTAGGYLLSSLPEGRRTIQKGLSCYDPG